MLRSLWLAPPLLIASAWLAFSNTSTGDYPFDAAPAVDALAHGHVSNFLHAAPIMGPFAVVWQAPFSLFGGSALASFQWACFSCLLAASALGWYLARIAGRRGASELGQALIALLCVVNPLTVQALRMGHPEEVLTAAFAIGAVAAAVERRGLVAALLLGLAVASKQWAVLAGFPVLMALPERRVRCAAIAAGLVVVLVLPTLIASPSAFFDVQSNAASGGNLASVWSWWHPAAPASARYLPHLHTTTTVHELPEPARSLSHWLIVLSFIAVPVCLWLRRRSFGLDGTDAMALLALLALLRCALDPVDNIYYHAPFLLALLGWDAVAGEKLPLRGLAGLAASLLLWRWSQNLDDPELFNAAYIAVTITTVAVIAGYLLRPAAAGVRLALRPG